MRASEISRMTMRVGIVLGSIGILLIALGPLIIGNFGTTVFMQDAPAAMTVMTVYLIATASYLPFSAALVGASLIMRHSDAPRSIEQN